ncbi:hypothetical protein ACLUXR_02060, partial [Limosilactobacillus reuteri subsp. suis]
MKSVFEALAKFLVGFLTAIIVSNKANILLKLLINMGIHNRSLQNTIVSLLVTFFVTCIVAILDHVYTNILFPMKINITSEQNEVKFKPNNNIYEPQRLNMHYEITPVVRIQTAPGQSAQVDWKEDFVLHTRKGTPIKFSIFLYVLGYSRKKYLNFVFDRKQDTLFSSLV